MREKHVIGTDSLEKSMRILSGMCIDCGQRKFVHSGDHLCYTCWADLLLTGSKFPRNKKEIRIQMKNIL